MKIINLYEILLSTIFQEMEYAKQFFSYIIKI